MGNKSRNQVWLKNSQLSLFVVRSLDLPSLDSAIIFDTTLQIVSSLRSHHASFHFRALGLENWHQKLFHRRHLIHDWFLSNTTKVHKTNIWKTQSVRADLGSYNGRELSWKNSPHYWGTQWRMDVTSASVNVCWNHFGKKGALEHKDGICWLKAQWQRVEIKRRLTNLLKMYLTITYLT